MPHLFAGLIAVELVAAFLFGAEMAAVHCEHTTVRASAPELFPLKNQGLRFHVQRPVLPTCYRFMAARN